MAHFFLSGAGVSSISYKDAGVDIDAGDALVERIKPLAKRTMHRRLVAEGTQFRKLDAECRYDIARQLLEHSALAMAEIAAALGYAETSVFTRAFRRWSGTTPTRWRVGMACASARA